MATQVTPEQVVPLGIPVTQAILVRQGHLVIQDTVESAVHQAIVDIPEPVELRVIQDILELVVTQDTQELVVILDIVE